MKKVILTGHSKGLGKAITFELINQGFEVLGLSRGYAENIRGLQQVSLDLSDSSALLEWIGSGMPAAFLLGATQAILVNNSGIVSPVNPLGKQSNREILTSVGLNVSAPLILSNVFVEHTNNVRDRRILHISSGAGRTGYPSWSVYCATKAALDHHARSVFEDGIANLKISSLAPGIVDTGMQAEIRSCSEEEFPQVKTFKNFKTEGDLATPGETAARICKILLSPSFGDDLITDVRDFQLDE
jgi:NAD(P)-dependent dehydrogenase (short-subunit alcohol dehydrogenase family)